MKFFSHLENVTTKLAEYIVKDGEGASKFLKIKIKGEKVQMMQKIGKSIANSHFKIYVGFWFKLGKNHHMIGKSGAKIDSEKLTLKFGNIPFYKRKKLN